MQQVLIQEKMGVLLVFSFSIALNQFFLKKICKIASQK